MIADSQQRNQALDSKRSFIVQAPAGSGKTQLLIQRYLKLLSQCIHPEEVLVMTFTNKAVAELTERISGALTLPKKPPTADHHKQTFLLAKKVLARSEQYNWQLLKQPERLKIMTIDALAMRICRQDNRRAQQALVVMEDWQTDDIYQQAVTDTLLLIADSDYQSAIANVFEHLDNDEELFIQLMSAMLGKRDQWLRHIGNQNNLDEKALQLAWQNAVMAQLENTNHLSAGIFTPTLWQTLTDINPALPVGEQDFSFWQWLIPLLLTDGNTWRKNITLSDNVPNISAAKATLKQLIKTLKGVPDFHRHLLLLRSLPSDSDMMDWSILQDITQVLKLCVAKLYLLFDEKQLLDYLAISQMALETLGEADMPSDTTLFFDYKTQHILLDEFQDTSIHHYQLLSRLVAGWQADEDKTIFLVGDPMQSIYRFREAEVALFLQVVERGIANILLEKLTLSVNFRATKSVVSYHNALFEAIFPCRDNADLGQIAFTESVAFNQQTNKDALAYYLLEGDDDEQAQFIVNLIQKISTKHSNDTIAVLARKRKHLTSLMTKLSQAQIDFQAHQINVLTQHWLVQDLLVMSDIISNPDNKLSWLSLLRSPWCGLLLDDLLLISDNQLTFYHHLCQENTVAQLSSDGQRRLNFILGAIQVVFEQRDSQMLLTMLADFCRRLSMFDYLSAHEQNIYQLFMTNLAAVAHNVDFSISQFQQRLNKLFVPSYSQSNIKLMTMHGAKGLEFDHVILPYLDKTSKAENAEVLLSLEGRGQLLMAPVKASSHVKHSKHYSYIQHINREKNYFERIRLLYVAMTRAKKQVYLLARNTLNKKKELVHKQNSLAALLENKPLPFSQVVPSTQTALDETRLKTPALRRIDSADFKAVTLDNTPVPNAPVLNAPLQDCLTTRYQQQQVGVLTHRYLQWQQKPKLTSIKKDLLMLGFDSTMQTKYAQLVLTFLSNAYGDKEGQWLFKPRESTQVESRFYFAKGKNSIVIDRLFIDDNTLWLIDFKTASPQNGETLATFIKSQRAKHTPQLEHYANIVASLYQLPIKKALYLLALPKLVLL